MHDETDLGDSCELLPVVLGFLVINNFSPFAYFVDIAEKRVLRVLQTLQSCDGHKSPVGDPSRATPPSR